MTEPTKIDSWNDLCIVLPSMTEEELKTTINYECSTYKRRTFIIKLHQRYVKLNAKRIRDELVAGETLL